MHLCWEEQAALLQWSQKHLCAVEGLCISEPYPSVLVSHTQGQMTASALPVKWDCLLEILWQGSTNPLPHTQRGGGGEHSHCCTGSAKEGDKVKVSMLYLAYSGVVTAAQWALQVSLQEGTCQTLWKESCEGLTSLCMPELPLPVLPSVSPQLTSSPPQEDFCVSLCLLTPSWSSQGQTPTKGISDSLIAT